MDQRKLLPFLFLVVSLFISCNPYGNYANSNETVYITNTGEKYHMDGCQYLSKSKMATTLAKAVYGGYLPCSVCYPPTLSNEIPSGKVLDMTVAQDTTYIYDFSTGKTNNTYSSFAHVDFIWENTGTVSFYGSLELEVTCEDGTTYTGRYARPSNCRIAAGGRSLCRATISVDYKHAISAKVISQSISH